MKPKLIFLALLLLSVQAFSQSKNTVSFVYGITSASVNIHGAMGDFGYDDRPGSQFGISYTRDINHTISLQTGIFFINDDVRLTTVGPLSTGPKNGNIKLITIPVLARVNFLKYVFVDGGLLGDFETNYSTNGTDDANHMATKQTGIGLEFGLGAKYNFGPVNIFVNPFLQAHALARFGNKGSNFNLMDPGYKFGLGYSF